MSKKGDLSVLNINTIYYMGERLYRHFNRRSWRQLRALLFKSKYIKNSTACAY